MKLRFWVISMDNKIYEKIRNINYVFWIIVVLWMMKSKGCQVDLPNVMFPLLGISACWLIHKRHTSGYLLFVLVSIIYSNEAIRYSLVGEYYFNIILAIFGNIIFFFRFYMAKLNLIEINRIHKESKKYVVIIKYAVGIILFILTVNFLHDAGSIFPLLETTNGFLLLLGFIYAWSGYSERNLFLLLKGFISLYIWVNIEDRIFYISFFAFYTINYLISIIETRNKINFKKDID